MEAVTTLIRMTCLCLRLPPYPRHKLDGLVEGNDGERQEKHSPPLGPAEPRHTKYLCQPRDIEDDKVQAHGGGYGPQEPLVVPRGDCQERRVLREVVERIEHLGNIQGSRGNTIHSKKEPGLRAMPSARRNQG